MGYLESDFKTELVAAFERVGCLCHKFPDLARGLKKPHDLIACVQGNYVGIETKLKRTGTVRASGRWSDNLIVVTQAHLTLLQHQALEKTEKAYGNAFVIAGLYDACSHQRMAFALSYSDFKSWPKWTLGDLRSCVIDIPWLRGQGWDLDGLLDAIING